MQTLQLLKKLNIFEDKMKIKLFLAVLGLSMFLLCSCEDSFLKDYNKNTHNGILGTLSLEEPAAVVLYTTAGKHYTQFFDRPDSNSVNVYAYITDGSDFVNPTSVYANNFELANMDNYVGQYSALVTPFPQGPPYNIIWNIYGWANRDYHGVQDISNKLDFLNLNYLDTVHSSSNLSISYSGFENIDSVSVQIMLGSAENYYFFNLDTLLPNSEYYIDVPDNGNILIPSSVLSNLPQNIYYSIALTNYKISTEQFHEFTIVKRSLYTVSTSFFLVQ